LTKRAKEKTSVINSVEDAVGFLINEELDEDQIREIKNQSIVSQFNRMNQHFGFECICGTCSFIPMRIRYFWNI
jgi:hypothetical protein